jgi:hypothetical protein
MDMKFIFQYWKLGVHFIFRTKRFGVNNEWWVNWDSMFGWSWYKRLWMMIRVLPIIENYKLMWFRSVACHFMDDEQKRKAGW